MNRFKILSLLATASVALNSSGDTPTTQPALYAITSWGDIANVYGPGTDPAMDTPKALENMIQFWKGRGYAGVYMRTDLGQVEPFIRRNPITSTTQASKGSGNSDPRLSPIYHYLDRVMEEFDYHETGQTLADKHGFEWWAWHPYIYSDGAPEWAGSPGVGRIWPWTYVDRYTFENQEIVTIDRKGNPYWMVREFAYPGARESKVEEFVHIARKYGVKRFLSCMRSEASQIQDAPDKADRYGFNKPIVDEMKRLYNVDIMTDSRFDVDRADFDPKDPMVQKWHELRGSYVTQFYRDLRKALHEVDPQIELGVTLAGDHVGPPLGNWRLDWRTWIDEGLVDMIVAPVFFEATVDPDALKKGYLTHSRENVGVIPYQVLSDYVAQSNHPNVKIIATDGPPYLFTDLPAHSDGCRIDAWYSAYHLAWYQRWWTQCVKDVEDFGYIRFLHQNFDGFETGSEGYAGGWGEQRYDPKIRACEGVWYKFGKGSDAQPVLVSNATRGGSGNAVQLTSGESSELIGMHRSFPDRSGVYAGVDNAITNGTARFEFWVLRPTDDSGLTTYLQDEGHEMDVGVMIAPRTGRISYSSLADSSDAAKWIETEHTVPAGTWTMLVIEANLDRGVYRGYLGADEQRPLWKDTPVKPAKERIVAHPNENIPMKMPSFKMFRQVKFIPQGANGAKTYVDDVAVKWTPSLHYIKPRPKVYFHDDLERHAIDLPINNARTERGGRWTTESDAGPGAFSITNDTSFGTGVNALLATGGGTAVAQGEPLKHIPNSFITVDLDLFVRSDKDYPYIMPDPTATSTHWAMVGLRRKGTNDRAVVALASRGTWWLWDGARFVDSRVRVAYDAWNHLQLAVDATQGSYQLVVQPVGEMPAFVGTAKLGEGMVMHAGLEFFIMASETPNHLSLYDNVSITAGSRP